MMPSPITWFTVPSYRWTASIIRSSTGSRSLRASSGSRSASSSIEPFRSAKSTVTCLRSPSRAALEVRIASARCLGVYVSGEPKRAACSCGLPTGWAHAKQNLAAAGSGVPQFPQRERSGAAHSRQNLAWGGFSVWHRGQVIGIAARLALARISVKDWDGGHEQSARSGRQCHALLFHEDPSRLEEGKRDP